MSGKLWSLITEIEGWNHTHPNQLFRETIFHPIEGVHPKFLHALKNDQILLAHPHWIQCPPYNFLRGVPNWLEMYNLRLYNFGAKGSSLTKLNHVMCCYVGVITALPVKIWEGKNFKNLVRFRTTFDCDREYL